MNSSLPHTKVVIAVLAVITGSVAAQSPELQELQTTLEVSARQIRELQAHSASLKAQNAALTASLAASAAESETAKQGYQELRGVVEGLGVSLLDPSGEQTRQRVINAASDLKSVADSRDTLERALNEMVEVAANYAKSAPTGDSTLASAMTSSLDKAIAALKSASSLGPIQSAQDTQNLQLLSFKADGNTIVINAGAKSGLKAGTPVNIYRGESVIARALIVEVRDAVSGGIVNQLDPKAPVQAGDRVAISSESF
jgi:cell shape-determining protein MreC